MTGNCTVCGKHGTITRGYCATHYARWRRHGDPNTVLPRGRPVVNFKLGFELRPLDQHGPAVPAQRTPLETVVTVCHTEGCVHEHLLRSLTCDDCLPTVRRTMDSGHGLCTRCRDEGGEDGVPMRFISAEPCEVAP